MMWENHKQLSIFRPIKEKWKEIKNIKCSIFFNYEQLVKFGTLKWTHARFFFLDNVKPHQVPLNPPMGSRPQMHNRILDSKMNQTYMRFHGTFNYTIGMSLSIKQYQRDTIQGKYWYCHWRKESADLMPRNRRMDVYNSTHITWVQWTSKTSLPF